MIIIDASGWLSWQMLRSYNHAL